MERTNVPSASSVDLVHRVLCCAGIRTWRVRSTASPAPRRDRALGLRTSPGCTTGKMYHMIMKAIINIISCVKTHLQLMFDGIIEYKRLAFSKVNSKRA